MKRATYLCHARFEMHPVLYLEDYHKYWLDQATRTVNPRADGITKKIMDIKEGPKAKRYGDSLNFFAEKLLTELKEETGIWNTPHEIAIVPSSTVGVTSVALDQLARFLSARNKNFLYTGNPLRRKTAVKKLSHGGPRDYDLLYNSLEVTATEPIRAASCLLLDDVMTTGHSMSSCATHLYEWGIARVTPLALGKTSND